VTAALDDPGVECGPTGGTVRLSTVLERVEQDQDLLDATHPEFERLRRRGGGLLGWLRSVLP
jgi:hypothetical protein